LAGLIFRLKAGLLDARRNLARQSSRFKFHSNPITMGTAVVRAVESQDGMTADWVKLPYEILDTLATRIINEMKGVNRCVFDINSKPPGTIER